MSKVILQDLYLNALRRDRIPVTLFTTNGYKIQGTIVSFDQFTILIVTPSGQNLVFKHAISTVIPARPVQFAPGTFDTAAEVNDNAPHAKNPSAPREDRS